jgi:hypothetical protein
MGRPETRDISAILRELGAPSAPTLLHLADAIYRAGYTGPMTIHWKAGEPKQVDLGAPVRLSIAQALDTGEDAPP